MTPRLFTYLTRHGSLNIWVRTQSYGIGLVQRTIAVYMSNRCEGLPTGACPESRCDKSVKYGIYDLFLCPPCEKARDAGRSTGPIESKEVPIKKGNKQSTKRAANANLAAKQISSKTIISGTVVSADGASLSSSFSSAAAAAAADSNQDSNPDDPAVFKDRLHNVPSQQRLLSESRGARGSCSEWSVGSMMTGLQLVAASSAASRVNDVQKVILNELLAYINVYRHNSTVEALQKMVLTHFSHDEITEAKHLLVREVQLQPSDGLTHFLTERRNSSARPAHEAEVEDVIGILDVADTVQALDGLLFVACNFQTMPKYGPEEFNLAAVVDRQLQLDGIITNLSASVAQIASNPTPDVSNSRGHLVMQSVACDLKQQLDAFSDGVSRRLDHLNAVCTKLAEKASLASPSRVPVNTSPLRSSQTRDATVDRSLNLMLFGVPEEKDAAVWRRKADQVLQFITGKPVDVMDMFRVGRFAQNKLRPIIVKLRTVWDKRIILSKSSMLKNFGEPIFIAADETLEVRRKNMLVRIQSRAERAGKSVSVVNGVLSVDNVAVFSLSAGKLSLNG